MNMDKSAGAERLLTACGEMDDSLLDEAETADIASRVAARRRVVQYSALGAGAAASIGIAVACLLLRPKRAGRGIAHLPTASIDMGDAIYG